MKSDQSKKKDCSKGAWSAEEDKKLAHVIKVHGAKRWRTVANIAGLNRCGKSCRMRWMNYLRPNIKRGNISDQEEDLILRLHKLLGNRWSLIAGRLPGRTDNEIKNYWNSHLSKKVKEQKKEKEKNKVISTSSSSSAAAASQGSQEHEEKRVALLKENVELNEEGFLLCEKNEGYSNNNFGMNVMNDLFDLSSVDGAGGPLNLEWVGKFLDHDHESFSRFSCFVDF